MKSLPRSGKIQRMSSCCRIATRIRLVLQTESKNDTKAQFSCPDAIIFYKNFMSGVDLVDQKVGIYYMDRKSGKWRRKVFYRSLEIYNILKQRLRTLKKPVICEDSRTCRNLKVCQFSSPSAVNSTTTTSSFSAFSRTLDLQKRNKQKRHHISLFTHTNHFRTNLRFIYLFNRNK